MSAAAASRICWRDAAGIEHGAQWRSETSARPPARVVPADDTLTADAAYRLACEGTGLLWAGDFHNARQLLQAMGRRFDRSRAKPRRAPENPAEAFHLYRMTQAQRARTLGLLLLPLDVDYGIPLGRAPDVREACREAWGVPQGDASVLSLRELLGVIGAFEWRRNGVEIPALGARIHPHYGVFSPVRGEYVDLVAEAPLPATTLAFDIGTGTGVLAALLAQRGVAHVIATDLEPCALACARDNLDRLGLAARVEVVTADLFPPGRAPLVVCNPPWLPAKANSALDRAVYDPDGAMLKGFLAGLADHLEPGGEGWLILSDLAERLGLRTRDELLAAFSAAGLAVLGRHDAQPRHRRASDVSDPLHAARSAEVTSLWRLGAQQG